MQFRTTRGLATLWRAHAFLVGRDISVSMGDRKQHIVRLATMEERFEK